MATRGEESEGRDGGHEPTLKNIDELIPASTQNPINNSEARNNPPKFNPP
jgi:hypothetical protein